jgi:GTP-binding protein Era
MRSGFVTLAGRPNVGKSTLLNALVGRKVSIVSDKPQTTRTQVRAIVNQPGVQLVFVDTPGIHKPVTALGERLNATAVEALDDIDVYCLVLDATQPYGKGDRFVAARLPAERTVVVVTKTDLATPDQVLRQLGAAAELQAFSYFPVSSVTGEGVPELLDHLAERMPEGPAYFPPEVVSDVPEAEWVAELVREQLLAATHDELPYSIATRVTEWEWPRIRVEIVVERESQKGMVIGKGGSVLKAVGTAVRAALPDGAFLDLHVTVDKDWQRRPDRITRLGY